MRGIPDLGRFQAHPNEKSRVKDSLTKGSPNVLYVYQREEAHLQAAPTIEKSATRTNVGSRTRSTLI